MTRLLGHIVAKNEANRYLESCLEHTLPFLDVVSFFDDRSTDNTREIAEEAGCIVSTRHHSQCSFLEHEGKFRQAAWEAMEEELNPKIGEWVFIFDADEFLVSYESNPRNSLKYAAMMAEAIGAYSVSLPIPEIFDLDALRTPLVRTDGFWSDIHGIRLVAYHPNGIMSDRQMGSGTEPNYVHSGPISKDNCGLHLLHYGYADEEDRIQKHARYSSHQYGHNPTHIASILQEPTTKPWDGPIPEVYRGTE